MEDDKRHRQKFDRGADWSARSRLVGALVFGDVLGLDVIGNITGLVEMLTSNGVVGLLVLAILMSLVK